MKSSHITNFVLTALLLVLIAPIAVADIYVSTYRHDANFNSAFQTTRACACGTTTDYFTLENTGDFSARYVLTLETGANWIEIQRTQLQLGPGESTLIPVTLRPPCGTEATTSYTVYATSQYGRYRAADRTVTAHVCENIGLELTPPSQTTLPCTQADFEVTVRNPGTFDERYTLTASQGVTLDRYEVSLAPGQFTTFGAQGLWACDVSGTQRVQVNAHATRNDISVTRNANVNILWDYDFLTTAPGHSSICALEPTQRVITVENTASVANVYTLKAQDNWVTLSSTRIQLQSGERRSIVVTLDPEVANVGERNVRIDVSSETGRVNKVVSIPVHVRSCYESITEVFPPQNIVCAGETDFTVRISNRGETTENFLVYTGGDIFSEIQHNQFTIRPGEARETTMRVIAPDRDEKYVVNVFTEQTPGAITTVTQVPLEVMSNWMCTRPDVGHTDWNVYTDTGVIPIIIENTGREATTYQLYWEGKVFHMQEQSIFLAPGEQGVLHLIPRDDIHTLGRGTQIERFILVSHRSEYRHDFHINLREKNIFNNAYDAIFGEQTNWCLAIMFVLFGLIILTVLWLILAYAGVIKKTERTKEAKKQRAYVLGVLALLFALLALVAGAMVQLPVELAEQGQGTQDRDLYYEFPMNTEYILDLDRYFQDPDGGPLTYTSSQAEKVRVHIQGSVATIIPDRNWYGQEYVVFTAQDGAGETTDSPIMTFRVLATKPVTFGQWVTLYCWTINALLFALLLLLLIAWTYVSPDKQLQERYGTPVRALVVPESRQSLQTARAPSGTVVAGSQRGTHVSGDVVAGDKVTIVNQGKQELYVASIDGKKFHPIDSHFVERMPKEKRVVFNSKEDAIKAGYSPSSQVR